MVIQRMTIFARVNLVFAAMLMLATLPAGAVQVFNEDIAILDATPGIIFDDTDVSGEEWFIRGRAEYFSIHDPAAANDVIYIDPASRGVHIGYTGSANGSESIHIGHGGFASGTGGLSLGNFAVASGTESSAVGHGSSAVGHLSTALGRTATSGGERSIALGNASGSYGLNSIAIGSLSIANGDASMALGPNAFTSQPNAIVMGSIPGINLATSYANVGMGTIAPAEAVDVARSAAAARFQLTSFTNTGTEAPQYIQRRARGTTASPSAVQNNDNLGLFSFRGFNGSVMGGSRATITAQAAGNFSTTSTPTRLIFATTPVGQTTPQQVLVITPDGKVQVNGSSLNVPDYVFEDNYELMPLAELRTFIDLNGHLPGIPSAGEVNESGLDLAGSDMAHLRKIEELTLYTLQQQAHIDDQKGLNESLLRENADLASRVAQLEHLVNRLLSASGTPRN